MSWLELAAPTGCQGCSLYPKLVACSMHLTHVMQSKRTLQFPLAMSAVTQPGTIHDIQLNGLLCITYHGKVAALAAASPSLSCKALRAMPLNPVVACVCAVLASASKSADLLVYRCASHQQQELETGVKHVLYLSWVKAVCRAAVPRRFQATYPGLSGSGVAISAGSCLTLCRSSSEVLQQLQAASIACLC